MTPYNYGGGTPKMMIGFEEADILQLFCNFFCVSLYVYTYVYNHVYMAIRNLNTLITLERFRCAQLF
jgi:hypothetical protein